MLNRILNSIKNNHFAQMAVCCALPVFVILIMQLLGFNSLWLYPIAILVCIGSHAIMMYSGTKKRETHTIRIEQITRIGGYVIWIVLFIVAYIAMQKLMHPDWTIIGF